jgi:acyl-CoA synthetase (AMP-forming)/AMP-acid ligase II
MSYLDEAGYLFIQDRLKDMIISGGENIYPRELENCLMDHASVIGVPDEKYGETPLAFIVPVAGSAPSVEEISAHCRRYLAGFKIPRQIEIIEQLPRNPSGKILKKITRPLLE